MLAFNSNLSGNVVLTRRKVSLRNLLLEALRVLNICPSALFSSLVTDSCRFDEAEAGDGQGKLLLFSNVFISGVFASDNGALTGGCRPRICLRSISPGWGMDAGVASIWLAFRRRRLGDGSSSAEGDTFVVVGLSARCVRSSKAFESWNVCNGLVAVDEGDFVANNCRNRNELRDGLLVNVE